MDDGSENIFSKNYWDDHDTTDLNSDGIADTPYPIDGLAHNQDASPLAVVGKHLAMDLPTGPSSAMNTPFPPGIPGFAGIPVLLAVLFLSWLRRRKNQR